MKLSSFPHIVTLACLLVCAVRQTCLAQDAVSREVTKEDMPRIPHTEADKALSTFRLARGFSLELVAAEPHVGDPVDACFDEFGRMFVAEMHGYPFSHEPTRLNPDGGGKKDAGIIRMLQDTNGDGRMDKSVVFADGISWPTSVCCYNGGVFVIAPQYLYYFKDTDGDDVADVREVVLSGFGRDNVQSVTNGLKWDLDNRIYFAAGRNPKKLLHRGKPGPSANGSDLRFDPKTETFEPVTGGLQFGHSMDNWGTRFVCSNSNHIQQVVYPRDYLARNPYLVASSPIRSIARDGASARVFRRSPPEPWRIVRQKWRAADKGYRLVINEDGGWEFLPLDPSKPKGVVPTEYPVGFFTSATGITIYRGNAYPREFRGNAFVGDVGGNLVHRKVLNTDGVVYQASRADQGEEFVASSDNWFRPVNFVNAPDGTLYVLDMYRETIEHPYSIPAEIKKFLDLTSGWDRGRVYRLVSPGMQRQSIVPIGELDDAALVAQLASDNGWNRETAQRLIWERQDKSLVALLDRLLASTGKPLGRLHALYSLRGLNALTADHVLIGLGDKHPRVRAHAVRLAEGLFNGSPELLDDVIRLAEDDSEHVRYQLAFSLGQTRDPRAVDALARLARRSDNSREITTALLSSVGSIADQLASSLLNDKKSRQQSAVVSLLNQLAVIVGSNQQVDGALRLLEAAAGDDIPLGLQQTLLSSVDQGLRRRGTSVAQLLSDKSRLKRLSERMATLFRRASQLAGDDQQSVSDRRSAIRLLALADWATASEALPTILSPQTPQSLQRAAVESLAAQSSEQVSAKLLEHWKVYSPQLRRDVVDALTTQPTRISEFLDAVDSGTVRLSEIEADKRQLLIKHPNKAVRARSEKAFGSLLNTNRAKVVQAYQDVLTLEGDASRGFEIFKKKCAVCHQVGKVGHAVAPNLASTRNKSSADLLIAILDPNREAQPNFNTYSVITDDGKVFTGIIAAESATSITLRRAEGKQDVILRSNIDQLIANSISLMPEGLEKDVPRQDLADVISFVKSIGKDVN